MIKIENVDVYGWEAAIRGLRNPLNSWEKSDSGLCNDKLTKCENYVNCKLMGGFCVGNNDLKLMQSLVIAGTDHSKFMRMINVTLDITAPLYFYKEWDTYKVGTVRNSCSTMHKIAEKEFTLEDFSCEHLKFKDNSPIYSDEGKVRLDGNGHICLTINLLNYWRKQYLTSKSKDDWWQMIQLLPSSYNQTRTVMLDYEVLANIYRQQKNYKLDEWREVCKWIETLPYSELITGEDSK